MATSIKWGSLGLLVLVMPSLVSAAVFNWERLAAKVADSVLRFEPRKHGHSDELTIPHPVENSAPAFCNGLDCPKFTVLKNESTYELRQYVATQWVSTTSIGVDFDTAQYTDFMRLFHYIQGDNVKKETIKMTAPVINRIIPGPGPACANNFTMSFFMSPKEGTHPQPSEQGVFLSRLPRLKAYVRSFPGFANKDKWLKEAVQLAQDLGEKGYRKDYYYTAGYNSPFQLTNRHNEIWFIAD